MSVGAAGKTAEELLADLLTEQEHIAVLRYASERDWEKDDVVYFLVASLKVFAFVHDRILRSIEIAQEGVSGIEAAVILADQNLTDSIERQVATVDEAFAEMNSIMGYHAGKFAMVAGELKGLKEEMDSTLNEARGTYYAFKKLGDEGAGTTLGQLFAKKAYEAIDRRVPYFDDTIRSLILTTITGETRKLRILCGVQFIMTVVLLAFFRR